MRLPLGTKIFLGAGLVVVAVLGGALLVTKAPGGSGGRLRISSARFGPPSRRSVMRSTAGARRLRQVTAALVQVPVYVSRIGESLRAGDRANLLDQADELLDPDLAPTGC